MPGSEREYAFLSYAHEDLDQVRKLYAGLKKRNVNAWFDKEDLGPGRWKTQIYRAISHSKHFVFCLSNAALKKTSGEKPGFQDEELQTAWEFAREQDERGFTIIPVRLEDCDRGDMRLSGWQQYDLFEDWDGVLDRLAVHMGGISLSDAKAKDERTEEEKTFERITRRADIIYFSGEYDEAISLYDAAIEIKTNNHQAWNNKGLALANLDRHEEALEAYNKATDIKKDDSLSWYNKGITLGKLGRHEEAIEAYDKVIEKKPDTHGAWYNKGIARKALKLRKKEKLKRWLKKIPLFHFFYRNFYPSAVFTEIRLFFDALFVAIILAIIGGVLYNTIFSGKLGGTGREPHGIAAIFWPNFTMGPLVVYLVYINYKYRMKNTERLKQFFTFMFFKSILFLFGFTIVAWIFYDFPLNKYIGFRQFIESQQFSYFLQETMLVLIWTLSISFVGFLLVMINNFITFPNRKISYLSLYLRQIALCVLPTAIGVIIIIILLRRRYLPIEMETLKGAFAGVSIRVSLFFALILDLDMSIKNGDIAKKRAGI